MNYLYSNVFGREPDSEGLAYWTSQLDDGNIERAELVGLLLAAASEGGGRDAEYIGNRTFVAVQFAQWYNSNPRILDDLEYDAAEVMLGVNENPDTIAAAQDKLYTHTGQIGDTFQLTPGIDTVEGTVLNDTIHAYYEDSSTLTNFDSIDGDGGWDVLNIYTNGAYNPFVPGTASVMNVEEVNIFNSGGILAPMAPGSKALTDASAYQGVLQLWQIDNAMSVTNLGADTVAGFENLNLWAGWDSWSEVSVQAANGVDTASIALFGVDGEDDVAFLEVGGNALSTVDIFGQLAHEDDMLALLIEAGDDVTEVTLTTDLFTYLVINLGNDDVTSLDASGSIGDVWYAVTPNMENVSMGSGYDVLFFADTPTLFQNIDGGDGYDVAAMGATRFQTQDYDAINQMTNIEGLAFYHSIFAGNDIAATAYAFDDTPDADIIRIDAAQVADFELLAFGVPDDDRGVMVAEISNLSADQRLEVTLNDVAILGLHNAAADVVLEMQEDSWAHVSIMEDGLGETGGTLTLYGEGSVDVNNVVDGGTAGKFAVIDASGLGGDLELEQMAAGFAETVILGEGAGNEITLTVGTGTELSSSTKGAIDVIVGFNSDVSTDHDVILLDGNDASLADVVEANVSGANTLNQAFAAAASEEYDGNLVFFLWQGDTYLFANTGTEAGYDNSDLAMLVAGEHDFSELGLIQWADLPDLG